MVPGIGHLSYIDRLRTLNIPSLAYRRKRGDMLLLYQMFQGHIDLSISDFFALARYSSTRGHSRKIFKSRFSCRAHSTFFSTRVISDWNSLPAMHLQFLHSKNNWTFIGLVLCTLMTFNLYFVIVFILIVV